jgi:broad specificity phosphatase PhoE
VSSQRSLTIDLIRHGEPEGGDILRGRVNPVLTELGWQQMRTAAALDSSHKATSHTPDWDVIITSPLKRCCEFAERTAAAAGKVCRIEDQWQEIDYGEWDGMPIAEWRQVAADQFKAFRKDVTALAPPNGEDFMTFKDRILNAWQSLKDLEDGSHILLVTHGGVMRVVLPTILGMPLNRSFPLHIPFACLSRIQINWDEDKSNASMLFHNGAEYAGGGEPGPLV